MANHTIQITNDETNLQLVSFLYSQQPYNAVYVPASELILYQPGDFKRTSYYVETSNNYAFPEFFMYGTRFWVIGDISPSEVTFEVHYLDTIAYNRFRNGTAHFCQSAQRLEGTLLAKEFSFGISPYGYAYMFKFIAGSSPQSNKMKIYNIFYINDNEIHLTKHNSIPFTSIQYNSDHWGKYISEENVEKYLYSKQINATLEIHFTGTKFWLEGDLDPNFGRILISIDGKDREHQIYHFRLYSETHKNAVIFYESKLLSYGDHTVYISAVDNEPISFTRLLYDHSNPVTSLAQNGLIAIPPTELQQMPANWTWAINLEEIYTFTANSTASCMFNGTKVYIYSARNKANGDMEVWIDNKYVTTVSLFHTTNDNFISFTSDDLPFGQHKIEVKHPGINTSAAVSVKYILYRPHLIYSGLCIPLANKIGNSNSWTKHDATYELPAYIDTQSNSTFNFEFNGTRFWISGVRGKKFSSVFRINIYNLASYDQETFYTPQISFPDKATNFYSVLLFESPILEYGTYRVIIRIDNPNHVGLCDFIFSQQPQDATTIYPKDMIIEAGDFTRPNSTYEFYRINKLGSYRFKYFGRNLWIFGNRGGPFGKCHLIDNGTTYNFSAWDYSNLEFQFIYNITFDYKFHSIEIKNLETTKILELNYVFYQTNFDPLPDDLNVLSISSKYFSYDTNWIEITLDGSEQIETTVIGSSATIYYKGADFWLEGYLGPCCGMAYIYIDGVLEADVSLYREVYGNSMFYKSPELTNTRHKILIANSNGNPIRISKMYHIPAPSTEQFTVSTEFTVSNYFSNSIAFTGSNYFSNSNDFTNSIGLTDSNDFSNSFVFPGSKDFSKSNSFSNSIKFTNSDLFSKSIGFTQSSGFSLSEDFTQSNHFSSCSFTKSISFTSSEEFTNSLKFSKSDSFSPTSQMDGGETGSNQKTKAKGFINVILGVIIAILVAAIIILVLLIIFIRRGTESTEDDNTHEAEASMINFNLSTATATHNENIDDELNSFTSEIFNDKLHHYEEDQNELIDSI